ncbi:hypothetical protein ACIBQ6_27170 [Nonomuraea sp. NPDC049655]|uniref:hypothetical protein n=1 Tax=Nonomuraea sp. NPDC049655 TaxID=3364355 RepID=UPI003791CCFB
MWIERAKGLYERGIYAGDDAALAASDRELDAVEAALCLARGRVLHVRFVQGGEADPRELPLFERAGALFKAVGDRRGEGESAFWEGCYHQVVAGDLDRALPCSGVPGNWPPRRGTWSRSPRCSGTRGSRPTGPGGSTRRARG